MGLCSFLAVSGLIILYSCSKDELYSKELLVYLVDRGGSATTTKTVSFVYNPLYITGDSLIRIQAFATREVAADIDITINPDISLVSQYNVQNGTSYLALPASSYRITNSSKQTIKAGSLQSVDSLKLQILHPHSALTMAGANYLLPCTIERIDSKDKGVRISTTNCTLYLRFAYVFNNIDPSIVLATGTSLSRTGWVATVSNTTSGAPATNLLDASNSTVWRSSSSSSAAKWVILNMGGVKSVKGFLLSPNYTSTSENPIEITVSTSLDNVNWLKQGVWTGTGPITGSSAISPDIKGITFISPVQAQYFQFTITRMVSSTTRTGLAEIYAVAAQ